MPILSQDIKLLRSAVMNDEPNGGGPMTGLEVVDGQSNNLFPDVSQMDLAFGRVNVRLAYGVAHSNDTDTLLGAHFVLDDAPGNPLVNCLLMAAPHWGADRLAMRERIERNLVKGPRLTARLMDTHYQGSQQVRLISFAGPDFPASSDTMVLRNPDGNEQYVRIIKIGTTSTTVVVSDGSNTAVVPATVATCDLADALERDFFGPPLQLRPHEPSFAQVFSTTLAGGARFFGVKALAAPTTVGDTTVQLSGGIFSALVPANRVERPLVDVYPLTQRTALARTALGLLSLPAQTLTMAPGTVLTLPTPCEPGTLTITRGATTFTGNADGQLLQGTAVVGAVDHRSGRITLDGGAPSYGSASTVLAYRPATPAGAAVHSDDLPVTTGNQGLVYTFAHEPPPAPGTYSLSYMAQGRWYELADAGAGRLAGADTTHGVGNINYSTGSVSVTLGAPPDVGSALIAQWGDAAVAQAVQAADLPTRLHALLPLDARASPGTVALAWSRGGTNYTATVSAHGQLSGAATGRLTAGVLTFEPAVLPSGDVTVTYNRAGVDHAMLQAGGAPTEHAPGTHLLEHTGVQPGSVRARLVLVPQASYHIPVHLDVLDAGDGSLRATHGAQTVVVGSVNYATGELTVLAGVALTVDRDVPRRSGGFFRSRVRLVRESAAAHPVVIARMDTVRYAHGALTGAAVSMTPAWALRVPVRTGRRLATSALVFLCGGVHYTSQNGALRRGWNAATGVGDVDQAGAVSDAGAIAVTAPPGGGTNEVTWINAAEDLAPLDVAQGIFRTANAPLKPGQFQIQSGALVGAANEAGVISGGGWAGQVDFQRGIVRWDRGPGLPSTPSHADWVAVSVPAATLSYNAVYFQFMPLDAALLGMSTARLPIDGKVPVHYAGGLVAVHHTAPTVLPNPVVQATAYPLGRARVASVRVRTATGALVPDTLYTLDLDAGSITFPSTSALAGLAQPFTVHHRIEDLLLTAEADLSGRLTFTRALTHAFPAGAKVSGVLAVGDVFGRASGFFDQQTWTGAWSDERVGADTAAAFNWVDYPVSMSNRGAITERWALIFTSTTAFRIVGERVGQIGTGDVNTNTAPLNPATGVPYFSINPLAWGGGWAVGNVLRINTQACGAPVCVIRTVLQGNDATNDAFALSFRGGVNA